MALAEGVEGPVSVGPGAPAKNTYTKDSAQRISSVHGDFYDSASRGNMFRAGIGGVGIAPGTALATTAQALVIYNPVDSGVNLNIVRFAHSYVGGTMGLGYWVLANYSTLNPPTNIAPGGTVSVVSSANGGVQGGKALAYNAATCTAAPILAEVLGDWEGVLDGTGATQVGALRVHKFDGSVVQKPGTAAVFTYVGGGGTNPKVAVSAAWEEVPI